MDLARIPLIFVRTNIFSKTTLYRVDTFYPPILKLIDITGSSFKFSMQFFQGIGRDRCTFFRGFSALLIDIAFDWETNFIGDPDKHFRMMQELEMAVPKYLWAE